MLARPVTPLLLEEQYPCSTFFIRHCAREESVQRLVGKGTEAGGHEPGDYP